MITAVFPGTFSLAVSWGKSVYTNSGCPFKGCRNISNFCFDTFFAVSVKRLCSLLPNIKLLLVEIVVVEVNFSKMLQLDSAIEINIARNEIFLYIVYFFL